MSTPLQNPPWPVGYDPEHRLVCARSFGVFWYVLLETEWENPRAIVCKVNLAGEVTFAIPCASIEKGRRLYDSLPG